MLPRSNFRLPLLQRQPGDQMISILSLPLLRFQLSDHTPSNCRPLRLEFIAFFEWHPHRSDRAELMLCVLKVGGWKQWRVKNFELFADDACSDPSPAQRDIRGAFEKRAETISVHFGPPATPHATSRAGSQFSGLPKQRHRTFRQLAACIRTLSD